MYSHRSLDRAAALIVLTAFAFLAHAQDGSYDTNFGSTGTGQAWFDVTPSNSDAGSRLIRLPNGNFFMGGDCGGTACAAWLNPSGVLANGYGTSGAGTAWFSSFPGWPTDGHGVTDAVALADGRVALIISAKYLAVLRSDGTGLDASVGNGAGYTIAAFESVLLRVTPQGQFIVVGATAAMQKQIEVARYDANFRLDTLFGSAGTTTVSFNDYTFPDGMTLQRDGKIVVIAVVDSSPPALGIVRLTADGAPDPDFGIQSDGKFESSFNNMYGAAGNAIVEDKKGRLVFVGYANTDSSFDAGAEWLVDRLLSGGATDPGFNGGKPQQFVIQNSSNGYRPNACCIALQSDNRIVVAGSMDRPNPDNKYFAIARFMDDGSFDSSFGLGGESYGDMSPGAPNVLTDYPLSMVIVPGGIIVGGSTDLTTDQMTVSEIRFSAAKERIDLLFADDFE